MQENNENENDLNIRNKDENKQSENIQNIIDPNENKTNEETNKTMNNEDIKKNNQYFFDKRDQKLNEIPIKKSKKETFMEVLLGLGITALAYVLIQISIYFGQSSQVFTGVVAIIFNLIVFIALTIVGIRFLRRGKKVAGTMIIIFGVGPILLGLLIFGACFILLSSKF